MLKMQVHLKSLTLLLTWKAPSLLVLIRDLYQIFIQNGPNAESSQSSFSFNYHTVEATGDFEITMTLSEDLNQPKDMSGLAPLLSTVLLQDLSGNEFEG